MFKILQKDSSIFGLTILIPLFKKSFSLCREGGTNMTGHYYEMYRMTLTVYKNTMGWNSLWRVITILMNLFFSRIFLNFYSKQNKCFINISWNWRCLKISKPIEKRCQTIVKKLSSKSLGGDIERYRSHKEKGSF